MVQEQSFVESKDMSFCESNLTYLNGFHFFLAIFKLFHTEDKDRNNIENTISQIVNPFRNMIYLQDWCSAVFNNRRHLPIRKENSYASKFV